LELIDFGCDDVFADGEEVMIYGLFESYGAIQKYIEENNFELISGGFERIPVGELKEVTPEQRIELDKLIDKFENDEDVQNVYHTMK
jgi:Uncharacterized conserved protein